MTASRLAGTGSDQSGTSVAVARSVRVPVSPSRLSSVMARPSPGSKPVNFAKSLSIVSSVPGTSATEKLTSGACAADRPLSATSTASLTGSIVSVPPS